MGRPRKLELSPDLVRRCAALSLDFADVAYLMSADDAAPASERTIRRRVESNEKLRDAWAAGEEDNRASLQRMYRGACQRGTGSTLIFWAKQSREAGGLGWKDEVSIEVTAREMVKWLANRTDAELAELEDELREAAAKTLPPAPSGERVQ